MRTLIHFLQNTAKEGSTQHSHPKFQIWRANGVNPLCFVSNKHMNDNEQGQNTSRCSEQCWIPTLLHWAVSFPNRWKTHGNWNQNSKTQQQRILLQKRTLNKKKKGIESNKTGQWQEPDISEGSVTRKPLYLPRYYRKPPNNPHRYLNSSINCRAQSLCF